MRVVAGGGLAQEFRDNERCHVVSCEVEASSHKGGQIEKRKKKVFARKSEQESQWLDDLSSWVVKADLKPDDQIFTRYLSNILSNADKDSVVLLYDTVLHAICDTMGDDYHYTDVIVSTLTSGHLRIMTVFRY